MNLRRHILMVGQEKIKFCMAEMIGSVNHLIKQVTVTKERINRCREDERVVLDVETEEESTDEIPNCVTTQEVITERLVLVHELNEVPVVEAAGEKELAASKQNVGLQKMYWMYRGSKSF